MCLYLCLFLILCACGFAACGLGHPRAPPSLFCPVPSWFDAMEKSYLRSYRAGERSYGLGSFSPSNSYTKSSRKFRYSGAHTTALDLTPAPAPPEMSHTARKYSSSSYSPSSYSPSCRRSTSKEESGRASADRLSAERYSGRGPSSDRLSSGYSSYSSSSRRGSCSSDLLTSASPSPSNYNYNGYSSSYNNNSGSSGTATPTSYSNGYSSLSRHVSNSDLTSYNERNETATTATSGRYSRQNSNDLSGVSAGKYSRTSSKDLSPSSASATSSARSYSSRPGSTYSRQSSTELPSSTVGASSSLYSRQNSFDATSPSPTPSTFVSGYATLDRRASRRRKDHLSDRKSADRVLDSPAYSSSTLDRKSSYGRTFSCDLPSCRTSNAPSSKYSGSNSSSNINNNNNNNDSSNNNNNKASESRGSDSRHERSPSIVAIHEGLARINKALQKHKQPSPEPQTSSALSGRPAAGSSSYYSNACDPSAIRAALGTCRSPNMRSPRGRVNHFASLKEASVEGEVNVVPDIVIPVSGSESRLPKTPRLYDYCALVARSACQPLRKVARHKSERFRALGRGRDPCHGQTGGLVRDRLAGDMREVAGGRVMAVRPHPCILLLPKYRLQPDALGTLPTITLDARSLPEVRLFTDGSGLLEEGGRGWGEGVEGGREDFPRCLTRHLRAEFIPSCVADGNRYRKWYFRMKSTSRVTVCHEFFSGVFVITLCSSSSLYYIVMIF